MAPNDQAPERADAFRSGAGPSAGEGEIFLSAVEQAGLPMLVTDPRQADNPIVFANAAFLRMAGYRAEEVLGRNCRFMQGPETDAGSIRDLRRAVHERVPVTVELLNYRRDGTPFWNALFVSPVFGGDGELLYFFGSQLDVTGQRATEAALRRSQKLEAVGQLTSGIAHDFNNLLMVVAGNVELMEKAEEAGRRERYASRVREAMARAQNLTRQLLAFARQQQLERRAVDLNALVASLNDRAERSLGPRIRLRTRLQPDVAPCLADSAQVEVALANLLLNARDAMPDGGLATISTGSVRLGPDAPEVRRGEVPEGDYTALVVADSGSGMAPEVLNRATEPFFTTKHGGPGSGLGLSTVYGFAQQSRGHFSLRSAPGRGTIAKLLLPCAPPRGGERVLLVDADPGARDATTTVLEGLGYSVVRVGSAHEAGALLDRGIRADLLLVDASAGPEGRELAAHIEDKSPAPRVLLLTEAGHAPLDAARSGRAIPALNKSCDRGELARRLREALGPDRPG